MHAILASHSARNSRAGTPSPPPASSRISFGVEHARHESTNEPRGLSGLGYEDDDAEEAELLPNETDFPKAVNRIALWKLGLSFFLFGLVNNVLYVIILSAALDLVPPSTPKGIIAFCNITPALLAKVGWPYFLKGKIRYTRRIIGCCVLSVIGIVVVAFFESLSMRLCGIGLASFSSGLGEITFLQLSTTYSPLSIAGQSVAAFASGTGAAGLVGAFLWWQLRGLGVRTGLGLSSIMPFITPLAFLLLLPRASAFINSDIEHEDGSYGILSQTPFTPNANMSDHEGEGEEESSLPAGPKPGVALSGKDKWRLVKPMLVKYMLPLFCVYLFEYTINQGIAPTLLYPVPGADKYKFLSGFIHSIRDYYPLWQLVYQTTVFFSRSSISVGIPALPKRLLALPAILQFVILVILAYESAVGFFAADSEGMSILLVFMLISLEGICGGLAYVNVFYRINQEKPNPASLHSLERTRQEREFKIGSVGFADSSGIVLAAIMAVPTEIELCRAQVARGKLFCKGL